jgi:glycosyltransferase involved in cell wall biosynthesis
MLLSVVIPTKNRPDTLHFAVRAALLVRSGDLEVVVQDCSEDDRSEAAIAMFAADERLRYAKSPAAPSMTENWNLAFERVSGDYAIVLGDDDAVGPEIVNAARWAMENDVDAVADERIGYLWPSYQLREAAGTVRITRHTGGIAYPDASRLLETTLRKYPFNTTLLPHIYHGLVRMRLMREIKSRTGSFFDSMAPDFYTTIALSCLTKQFARVGYPLCASGASAAANSGRVHEGKDYLHALEYQHNQWSAYVPPFYSMSTSIFDATIKALNHMGRRDLVTSLDFANFYAECLGENPASATVIVRELRRFLRDHPAPGFRTLTMLVPRLIQMAGRRARQVAGRSAGAQVLKRLKSQFSSVDYDVIPAPNIVEALEQCQQLLRARGVKSPFAMSQPARPVDDGILTKIAN